MRKNKRIDNLMRRIKITPITVRDRTTVIFSAYSTCVRDRGGADPEIFGQKKLSVKASVGVKSG